MNPVTADAVQTLHTTISQLKGFSEIIDFNLIRLGIDFKIKKNDLKARIQLFFNSKFEPFQKAPARHDFSYRIRQVC